MQLVNLNATIGEVTGVLDPGPYLAALPSFAHSLPEGARAFATDPEHYAFYGQRCVKDLSFAGMVVGEQQPADAGATGPDPRDWIDLAFRHNCWKHDADLTIRYFAVAGVSIELRRPQPTYKDIVVLDEILAVPQGCTHEIAFHGGGALFLTCSDLVATWNPADCPER